MTEIGLCRQWIVCENMRNAADTGIDAISSDKREKKI